MNGAQDALEMPSNQVKRHQVEEGQQVRPETGATPPHEALGQQVKGLGAAGSLGKASGKGESRDWESG